jgi:hypothetical protein
MLFVCYFVAEGFWEEFSVGVINQKFTETRINLFYSNKLFLLSWPPLSEVRCI